MFEKVVRDLDIKEHQEEVFELILEWTRQRESRGKSITISPFESSSEGQRNLFKALSLSSIPNLITSLGENSPRNASSSHFLSTQKRGRTGTLSPSVMRGGMLPSSPRQKHSDAKSLVPKFLRKSETLPKKEFDYFWECIGNNIDDLFYYLTELVSSLNEHFVVRKRASADKDQQDEDKIILLVNTLAFIVLTYSQTLRENATDMWSTDLLKQIRRWKEGSKAQKAVRKGLSTEINVVITKLLEPIICNQSNHTEIEEKEEKELIRALIRNVAVPNNPITAANVFVWSYLFENACTKKDQLKTIFSVLTESCKQWLVSVNFFKNSQWSSVGKKVSNPINEVRDPLMALLHMMGTIMTYCRVDDPDLYNRAMVTITPLYSMPKPLGAQALKVLTILQTEQRTSGYSLIKRYLEETWCPRIVIEEVTLQPLFYIINEHERSHLTWASILGINPLEPKVNWSFEVSESAMAIFLLGTLKYVGGKEINQMVKNALLESTSRSLSSYWSTLNDILSHATRARHSYEVDMKEDILDKLDLLYEKILKPKLPRQSVDLLTFPQLGSCFLSGTLTEIPSATTKSKNRSIMRRQRSVCKEDKTDSIGVSLEELKEPYSPALPGIYHAALQIDTKIPPIFPQKGAIASHAQMFPQNGTFDRLQNLFEELKDLRLNADLPLKIRLVITGGSDTLHHLTIAFVNLLCERKVKLSDHRLHSQEVTENIELELFLVPLAPSLLADYLAGEDIWYRRHVYTPFKSLSLLTPSVISKVSLQMDSVRSNHALGYFYQNLINNYIRGARNTFKVHIWVCHGFKALSRRSQSATTNTPDMIIPYTTRFDFGELVNPEYKPKNVTLKWTRVNRSGTKLGLYTEPAAQYESIICAHTPDQEKQNKKSRYPASPSRSYFELHCVLTQSQRKKQLKTSYFVRNSYALVSSIEITANPGDEFHVKLDKQCYGPYRKVKLQPLRLDKSLSGTKDSPQVYMKLRTFYNIFDPLRNN